MTPLQKLKVQIKEKKSYLCIGLDTDLAKIPPHLLTSYNPILSFNQAIIEATKAYSVAYKINTAFYEVLGSKGWDILKKTLDYIPDNILTIADAKRGDIGNTAQQYARAFFETLNFDAITLAPYMGRDSISPFLNYKNKVSILLALTSNQSSLDFETLRLKNGNKLYEEIIIKSQKWIKSDQNNQIMYVVGATQEQDFKKIRDLTSKHFLLVPGVGTQGGSLAKVSEQLLNSKNGGLLVNFSRSIIYASQDLGFENKVQKITHDIQQDMEGYLQKKGLISNNTNQKL